VSVDANEWERFYDSIKRLPAVNGTALQRLSFTNFRETMAIIVTAMANIYTGLSVVIAFGVVYNSGRISLSERARELASLRVLGFSQSEVLRILFLELALLTLLAQPPGRALGYGLAWTLKTRMEADVMRARLIVEHSTYALASGIVLAATVFSALAVRRHIKRLDLVAVLKTRD
jgi:putative ABC transport system permease protein